MADQDSIEYYEKRADEEHDAATRAESDVARKIHLDLAAEYAARADRKRRKPTLGFRDS